MIFCANTTYFDLESSADPRRLGDEATALSDLRGLVVIDDIQRRPDLFPFLRVLADRPRRPASFLVLGTASPHLLKQSSETLAGRITYHELEGFGLQDTGAKDWRKPWLRGGSARSYLARNDLWPPGSAQRLLVASLDDTLRRANRKGTWKDVTWDNPRISVMAAFVLSLRWPAKYSFPGFK